MVLGDGVIQHLVEGQTVLSLESESHPIEFRKGDLLNLAGSLDRKASNGSPRVRVGAPAALAPGGAGLYAGNPLGLSTPTGAKIAFWPGLPLRR